MIEKCNWLTVGRYGCFDINYSLTLMILLYFIFKFKCMSYFMSSFTHRKLNINMQILLCSI